MSTTYRIERIAPGEEAPPEGTRRQIDEQERVFYDGYWIKTYPVPSNTLEAKKKLIEALTRRLFNHTEHGLNIPGTRLNEARQHYETETDPGLRRVKAGMLAGALFNRATDIFRKLVELQACGVEIPSSNELMRECGRCLIEAMELGRYVLHRSGEEGIDELWGEPFRAFSIPIEDLYESRYIKIGQSLRDIDRLTDTMSRHFSLVPAFSDIGPLIQEFSEYAKIKTELLRTDEEVFTVWPLLVTAGERLANFCPHRNPGDTQDTTCSGHSIADGLHLIRQGRDLIFYITRARTPMPKSTREYVERCETYIRTGRAPVTAAPLPA